MGRKIGYRKTRQCALTLLEVVLVVAIMSIIAAIAIPRMGAGTRRAEESALRKDLDHLHNAMEFYAVEHGGDYPSQEDQLLLYSDQMGSIRAAADHTHIYGPYLQNIPPLPVGAKKGRTGIDTADGNDVGWIVDWTQGNFRANTRDSELDSQGIAYNDY
jgi:prepilin-type N-terminal cleavage/methylation domain-containing protein